MTTLSEENLSLGGDPAGCGEFAALGAELAKLNHPACPDVDWLRVEHLCLMLFREHGMELQSAAAFALARAQLHGLDGMDDGLHLLNRLLVQEWERVWPPALPVRLEILAWLFNQLQPLLRRQGLSVDQMPALRVLDDALRRLSEWLEGRAQAPLISLLTLRKHVQAMIQRLARDVAATGENLSPVSVPEVAGEEETASRKPIGARRRKAVGTAASSAPAMVVLKLDIPEQVPPPVPGGTPVRRRRALWPWLLMLAVLTLLTGVFLWWGGGSQALEGAGLAATPQPSATADSPEPTVADPVRLDSVLLFPPGSAELKPGSDKVLITSLINIKAQPGRLIVITGHSDSTGDAQRNVALSRARAASVRDWMQRMGDIPDNCFVVRGAGASEAIASNDTEEGRNANRRVEITLVRADGACEAR